MNLKIATTTINPPTEALLKYASFGMEVIVAGDLKTQHNLFQNIPNVTYIHPNYQESKYKKLSDLIGWNCMERKNMAILEAYSRGADYIALIDDDNIHMIIGERIYVWEKKLKLLFI